MTDSKLKEILKAQCVICATAAKAELSRVCLAHSSIGQEIISAILRCGDRYDTNVDNSLPVDSTDSIVENILSVKET